jgi:hypothetical protein
LHIVTNTALLGNCDGGSADMLFREKISLLLHELGVSNVALSRASELDVSLISRFRSGERVPSRFSPQLDRLATGAATLAVQLGKAKRLCEISGVPACEDTKAIYDALAAWINQEDSGLKPQRARTASPGGHRAAGATQQRAFAETLNALMIAAGVSNAELAYALNTDAQHISRIRSGMRRPDLNGRLTSNICTYLCAHPATPRQRAALCELAGANPSSNSETLYTALFNLLHPHADVDERIFTDNLLAKLDEQQEVVAGLNTADFPHIEGEHPEAVAYYAGSVGFQAAIMRLVGAAMDDPGVRELVFYSDQPCHVLSADEDFCELLASQIIVLLKRGVRLRVIHDLGQSPSALLRLFEKWMPLYLTGQVQPYFCRCPRDIRFSVSMFIAGRKAAVTSMCVTSALPISQYQFTDNLKLIANMRVQFAALLRSCLPLTRMYLPHQSAAYLDRLAQFERAAGDTDVLLHSLSIYSMPHALLKRILARGNVPDDIARPLLNYHALSVQRAHRNLSLYHVADYIALPPVSELAGGRVRVPLTGFQASSQLFYTPDEYGEHLAAMVQLMRKYPRYEIYVLPDQPFAGISVIMRQGVGALINKTITPEVAFFCEHPLLHSGFSVFFDSLKLRARRVRSEGAGALGLEAYIK